METIKVKATVGFAFGGVAYLPGDEFEIKKSDLSKVVKEVVVVNKSTFRKPTTKVPKKAVTKSKKVIEK